MRARISVGPLPDLPLLNIVRCWETEEEGEEDEEEEEKKESGEASGFTAQSRYGSADKAASSSHSLGLMLQTRNVLPSRASGLLTDSA